MFSIICLSRPRRLCIVILSQLILLLVHEISVLIWLTLALHGRTLLVTRNVNKLLHWGRQDMRPRNSIREWLIHALIYTHWLLQCIICLRTGILAIIHLLIIHLF